MFPTDSKIQYQLAIPNPEYHEFTIEMTVPAHSSESVMLTLPAWIPGSYMIRDFAKSIVTFDVQSLDGNNTVAWHKADKQTWAIESHGNAFTVLYTVYANDLSIRSAFINHEYAFINGTSAFLQIEGSDETPCELTVIKPNTLNPLIETSLPMSIDSDSLWQFTSTNYDDLIDHPLFVGESLSQSFWVDGIEFVLLFSGTTPVDIERVTKDLIPICEHHLSLFGKPYPVTRYVFMTLLSESGYGGLEHMSSTALLYPRYDLPLMGESDEKSDGYITFLSLCSHELFHTWHVKRIKPAIMVTPDLSQETYTNQLWIYEGFTSFYDDVTLARAGTITPQKYLDIIAQTFTRVAQNAGRFKQSIAESSFDAWTKFYKQDASATNNIVSYYAKGGIVAFGLDLLLREQSNNQVSLDSVMQVLWRDYGKDLKGTPDDVIQTLCTNEFSIDVSDYLNAVVYGTQDVPLSQWLSNIGISLHYRARTGLADKGGISTSPAIKHQLGATVKESSIGVKVAQVFNGLAASIAGIYVGDTIIAVNDTVASMALLQRLLDTSTGDKVNVTLIRDGKLLTVSLSLIEAQKDVCYFSIDNTARFNEWLGVS